MSTLTVFTPTFNRAYCLSQVYNSLCRQTVQDFEWLIIDDGSTDTTQEMVKEWIKEGKIKLRYIYKENGGMHSAHNCAYVNINTPYNVCTDSDDYLPDDAVEIILNEVSTLPEDCAGIVGLDADFSGQLIGTKIPEGLKYVRLDELYSQHKVKGDKKLVLKTDVVRQFPPYPEYTGERFVPLDYLYLLINQKYDLKAVNKILCMVEYRPDGSTHNILRQYRNNPNGFAFSRVSRIKYEKTFVQKFKNAIHLVSSSIFAKRGKWLAETNRKELLLMAFPFGLMLNFYIRYKTR